MKKRFLKSTLPLITVMMLVVMIVGGCASTEPVPAEPTPAETVADPTVEEEEGLVFGNIPAALSDEWNGYSVENFMFAAEKKGVEVQVIDPNWDDEHALNSLQDFIVKGVDAVSVFVLTPEQAQAFVDIANEAQMPVAFENTNLSENPHFPPITGEYVFNVHEDYRTEAYKAVSYAAQNNLGSKLFYLRGMPGMGIAEESHAGVDMAVAEYDNIELVGYRDTQWNTETGQNALSDVIQAGIDFDVVFCNNEPIAVGALNALRDAGLEGDIPVVASNGSPNGLRMIEEGELAATVSVPVSLQGLYIFKALYLYTTQGIVPPYTRIVIPSILIDQSNVHEAISWQPSEELIDLIGGLDNWDTKGVGEYYE